LGVQNSISRLLIVGCGDLGLAVNANIAPVTCRRRDRPEAAIGSTTGPEYEAFAAWAAKETMR
jgi:hypothetical protein